MSFETSRSVTHWYWSVLYVHDMRQDCCTIGTKCQQLVKSCSRHAHLSADVCRPLDHGVKRKNSCLGNMHHSARAAGSAIMVLMALMHANYRAGIHHDSCCRILKAYPGVELQTEDDRINVEMDPEDDFRVRQQMQQENMRCAVHFSARPYPTRNILFCDVCLT